MLKKWINNIQIIGSIPEIPIRKYINLIICDFNREGYKYKKLNLTKFIPKIKQFLKDKKSSKIGINKTPKIPCRYTVCDKEYDLQTREFPDYPYFYDEELFELVYEIYKDDFEAFGYEKYKL